jgi:hypothetical protein
MRRLAVAAGVALLVWAVVRIARAVEDVLDPAERPPWPEHDPHHAAFDGF